MAEKSGAIHGDVTPSFIATASITTPYVAVKYNNVRNKVIICEDAVSKFAGILQSTATASVPCEIKTQGYSLARAGGTWALLDPLTATTGGELIKSTGDADMVYAIALQVVGNDEIGEVYILPQPVRRTQFNAMQTEVIDPTTPASTGKATLYTMTPTGSVNVPMASVGPAGTRMAIKVLTSGTNSYTLTFTTNMLTTGTLATGTASAKVFLLNFISDGTNWIEVSRTTAI